MPQYANANVKRSRLLSLKATCGERERAVKLTRFFNGVLFTNIAVRFCKRHVQLRFYQVYYQNCSDFSLVSSTFYSFVANTSVVQYEK